MSTTTSLYSLSLEQIVNMIYHGGADRTTLVQGHMGWGKSTLLTMLGKLLPDHTMCYFDCTTKMDSGDIAIPQLMNLDEHGFVRYIPNEELGLHLNKPILFMADEIGKCTRSVQTAMNRVFLEGKFGSYTLHPDSRRFATTNLAVENVGDALPAHVRNRLTVVNTRKPTKMEWIEWGINNGIDHAVLGWARETDKLFQSFEDVKDPSNNEYIFHPAVQRAAFFTGRSGHAASDWVKQRQHLDNTTLTAALIGTIGEAAAKDLMTFIAIADKLPTLASIKADPLSAIIPTVGSAAIMVVYKMLGSIKRDNVDPYVDYMMRLDHEAQGYFANGVRSEKYEHRDIVMQNRKFTKWSMDNTKLFTADKK